MKKLELIQTKTYEDNIERFGGMNPCVRCGKDVKNEKYSVHLVDGDLVMLSKEDEDKYVSDSGDMYWHPIGSECAKHIPKEFLWTK
jgi:hypothetical protein